jgi:putative transposase
MVVTLEAPSATSVGLCLAHAAGDNGIRLRYRPPGQPHFGGTVERLIDTIMQMVAPAPS